MEYKVTPVEDKRPIDYSTKDLIDKYENHTHLFK